MINLRFSGKIGERQAYLCRIDKRKARALFNLGRTIYLIPSNFVPFGAWIQPCPINPNDSLYKGSFDELTQAYSYYNCINSKTGFFPAYYIDLLSNECLKPIKL